MDKRFPRILFSRILGTLLTLSCVSYGQVDTSYIFNPSAPFGALDIRISQSATRHHYLTEDETFSFRGTSSYYDMTSWDSSPYREGYLTQRTEDGDFFVMNYRLLVPDEYQTDFVDGYPLIVVFHGLGERGNCAEFACYHADRSWSPVANDPPAPTDAESPLMNNDHSLLHGGQVHLEAMKQAAGRLPGDPDMPDRAFPGFVLFPQNLNGWDKWSVEDAIRIVRLIIKKYNIDEDRIYVEGISNGGHGLYQALKRAPWLFAAGIAMSSIDDGFINGEGVAESVAHIPVWMFQGGMDTNPRPSTTMRYMHQFRAAGSSIRYTLYPELGHGTWNKAFNEPDFFSWMLSQSKSKLHSYQLSQNICSDSGTRLEVAAGFPAYQWEHNGQMISDATGAVYYAKEAGDYRVRFARVANPGENQWNSWSDPITLSLTDPPQASITQRSTVRLPGLDGGDQALLRSSEQHETYQWYRDGQLLDLPGSVDDTLRNVVLPASVGDGNYTLVVSDSGCQSLPSAPVHIIYEDRAQLNTTAPADFGGISLSPSETVLSWSDQSDNETGFEIWRRSGTGEWEWIGVTGADVTTFDDVNVEPDAVYQYKIRTISETGRSDYFPAGAEGITVETETDEEPPGIPDSLSAEVTGIGEVTLTWSPSSDNSRIREYVIRVGDDLVHTQSTDTTYVLTNLPVNSEYDIQVFAVDLSRNEGAPGEAVHVSTYVNGLYYTHTTGAWTTLDSIDWSWAEFEGTIGTFSLSPKTQEDYYNLSFDGFLFIENGGVYQFRVTSSDGSRLWLNDELIVDNDGVHDDPVTVTSNAVDLAAGAQRVYLQFFEYLQLDTLAVEYNGPDTGDEWMEIPRAALKSDENLVTAVEGDNGLVDSFFLTVFPNPTTPGNIRIGVRTPMPAPVRVRMHDATGRLAFDALFDPVELVDGLLVPPGKVISDGMYIIEVTQGRVRKQEKLIIRR